MRKNYNKQQVVNRESDSEQVRKQQLEATRRQVEEALSQANEVEDTESIQQLEDLLSTFEQAQQANCPAILIDQCALELPANSVIGVTEPPLIISVLNDPFFLDCCITPVQVSASTPCGDVEGVTVNEVKAVGYLNYYFNLEFDTFFDDGESNCTAINRLPFSCTGTTCANEVLCYASVKDSDPCPDFCNFGVQSFAVLLDVILTDNKAVLNYAVIHLLPGCDREND
ncbi:hypothetical protein [Halobacillus sp. A5]|uniref:hypothetical protein n=1 Tax=Halobacillus sp. A5 TaxID=2880263 RepID=UPI0020A621F6|nr:hypothetical protein [Halobacillus sp. A5]MCP3028631.1 hypothetical protein [Halobacillus sp. A5]